MDTKTFIRLLVLPAASLIISTGCHKSDVSKPFNQCDTTNTTFNQLYANLLTTTGNMDDTLYDGRIHSYTFEVGTKEIICKIGYQNLGPGNTQPDLIEIYDSTTNSLLYSGSHFFDSTKISYISINPVALEVGHTYTISRTRNYVNLLEELIGRLVRNRSGHLSLPVTFGNLTIISSSFSQNNTGGLQNFAIPFIDLVFE
jgi:hypothetical protein